MPALPETVFVFVSKDFYLTANNFEVLGHIASASAFAWEDPRLLALYESGRLEYLLTEPPRANALPAVSPFSVKHQTHPVERRLEDIRFSEFGLLPSRFGALYAFLDRHSTERAADQHGWDRAEIREVRLVPHPLTRAHRANMNLISLLHGLGAGGAPDAFDWDSACRSYWQGDGTLPVTTGDERFLEPLWEVLIDGRVQRIDEPQLTMAT